jgi:hypothetical protein
MMQTCKKRCDMSSLEPGERLELVRANARDLQNNLVCKIEDVTEVSRVTTGCASEGVKAKKTKA